ncbi:MAG: thioesterase family protein [Polyangiaceae bacterium]
MFRYRREVRFQEVDAAGLMFFPNFLVICHEAMEDFFGELGGGYAGLIRGRSLGLPCVGLETQFFAPLRHGEVFDVELRVLKLGNSSLVLGYRFVCSERLCAEVRQTVVLTDLQRLQSTSMPEDVRALCLEHLAPEVAAS